jgi:uncharacterized BrkB/YihY/UPF0761 family membrane protein
VLTRFNEWAREHPWQWTGLCAGVLFAAVVVVFRVTLDRDFGDDVVLAAVFGMLFWVAFGVGLSAYSRRRGD